eukprot:CAMPEP_0113231246 /NCGR_PEP_ID=MMETSP0008_2-20120614/1321_1 /TAXON_ID=97485 /ORGANISM="Prymnesium parvum" /LENGTH=60 /DNA_ID=CAMNT_0000077895 /DNA_START=10 /DNA_END=190 /DNA_ORIENTATION=+ /assembly_acc=CAM_ASM_000153
MHDREDSTMHDREDSTMHDREDSTVQDREGPLTLVECVQAWLTQQMENMVAEGQLTKNEQ